jgi:Fe-S-cluster-containing dehydrogenase component
MYFGDINDPSSEISQILSKRKYKVLAPEAGTRPQVYYLI